MSVLRRALGAALLGVLFAALGCGPKMGQVSGKVTFGSETLGSGQVVFHGDNHTENVAIQADGTYSARKMPIGKYVITVETTPPPGGGGGDNKGPRQQTSMGLEGGPEPGKYVAIPAKYANKDTSGLSIDVAGGKMQHDIALTK